jgi:hypothetical protein
MSERRLAVALLAVLAGAAPAAGQDAAALRARIARVEPIWRAAARLANLVDSTRRFGPLDTLRSGPLTVYASPQLAPLVRDAMARARPILDSVYGQETARLAAHRWYVVPAMSVEYSGSGFVIPVPEAPSLDLILTNLLVQASYVYGQDEWLGGFYGYDLHPERALADAYIELVTAPSRAARGCLLGSLPDCALAFGLIPGADTVMQWYDAQERRQLVGQTDFYRRRAEQAAFDACTAGSDAACVGLLRSTQTYIYIPRPLGSISRTSLLRTAFQLGGSGAFHQWIGYARSPAARLAAAAGASTDSLLSTWRAEVLAARPKTVIIPDRTAWVTLLWGTVLTLVALRSTRWR